MRDSEAAPFAVIACGALIADVRRILERRGWQADLYGIPATYHMRPWKIIAAVDEQLQEIRERYRKVIVAYGDCGTAGELDSVLQRHGAERLSGAHCYEIYCGCGFEGLQEREPTTYFLTDYLVWSWDEVVAKEMGLDLDPSLKTTLFGGFTSITYVCQTSDPELLEKARSIASDLGLPLVVEEVGLAELEAQLARLIDWE
jgi:hypothetical protein